MTIIYAILIFCLLIFVHEFGHFAVAKLCGVKVNEFALGMGPAIIKKQKGETLYALRLLPIGGYCAMEGEDEESDEPRAFGNKPAWQRACILVAGAFMNLVTCVVLLTIMTMIVGQATTVLEKIEPDSPAMKAGLKPGDRIVAIDDKPVEEWNDVIDLMGKSESDTAKIDVERDGENLVVTPQLEYDEKAGRKRIGITAKSERNPITSISAGVKNTALMTSMMYSTLKQLVTGDVSVKELSGPVGVVYVTNQAAKSGLVYVIYIAALLSLNLAIVNMLPFPALDGGRVLFLFIRLFTGKKVTDEIEGKIHFIGICLLFAFMIMITINDVIKFVIPAF